MQSGEGAKKGPVADALVGVNQVELQTLQPRLFSTENRNRLSKCGVVLECRVQSASTPPGELGSAKPQASNRN